MITTTSGPAVLCINGEVVGTITAEFPQPPVLLGAKDFPMTHSWEGFIKATKSTVRAIECFANAGMKDFYHWQRVKLAQERRRLKRRRQGRS